MWYESYLIKEAVGIKPLALSRFLAGRQAALTARKLRAFHPEPRGFSPSTAGLDLLSLREGGMLSPYRDPRVIDSYQSRPVTASREQLKSLRNELYAGTRSVELPGFPPPILM
jgi:hypothetical protein